MLWHRALCITSVEKVQLSSCMEREKESYLVAFDNNNISFLSSVSADISNASPEDIAATVASSLHYITSKQGN